jgi:hypothetical protein
MPEVHTTINGPRNEVSIVFHNPGRTADQPGAGVPVVSTGTPLNKNAVVHGQIPGTSIIFNSPA